MSPKSNLSLYSNKIRLMVSVSYSLVEVVRRLEALRPELSKLTSFSKLPFYACSSACTVLMDKSNARVEVHTVDSVIGILNLFLFFLAVKQKFSFCSICHLIASPLILSSGSAVFVANVTERVCLRLYQRSNWLLPCSICSYYDSLANPNYRSIFGPFFLFYCLFGKPSLSHSLSRYIKRKNCGLILSYFV